MNERVQQGTQSACPHPEAVGKRWSDRISTDRQAELQAILDAWDAPGADHGDRKGPFDARRLTGEEAKRLKLTATDVRWLSNGVRFVGGGVPQILTRPPNCVI